MAKESDIAKLMQEVEDLHQREQKIDDAWEKYRELYNMLDKVFGSSCNLQHYPSYGPVCTRPHSDWNYTITCSNGYLVSGT